MRQVHVKKIMQTPLEYIEAHASMLDVAKKLQNTKVSALMVKEGNNYIGIVSERDIVYKIVADEKNASDVNVKEAMTSDVVYAHENDSIHDCYDLMNSEGFRHLPIKDKNEEVVGMVSVRSIFSTRDSENQFLISQLKKYIEGDRQ